MPPPEAKDARRRLEMGAILEERWKVEKILGEGAFGAVYEVSDQTRPGKLFALKIISVESNAPPVKGDPPKMLPLEVTVLRALRNNNARYFPGYESCGQNDRFNYVVMGLVGKNVSELRKAMPHKRFTIRSALHIGDMSMLSLQEIHDIGFLHRDLKPANMCIGRAPDDLRSVYILDWGLCRRFMNERGQVHRPRVKAPFRGTPRYASVNALNDTEQGRSDDVWSWYFTLVELTVGRLPWDGEKGPQKAAEYLAWMAKRKNAGVEDPDAMCKDCPREYRDLYNYIRPLNYSDRPDYEKIRGFLAETMSRRNIQETDLLDWEGDQATAAAEVPDDNMMQG